MTLLRLTACLTAALLCLFALPTTAQDLRVMTYNIRFDNPQDGIHAWPNRQERVASTIRFHDVDVAGLQEALRHQIDTLAARLPGYAWLGVGRDDGRDGGEFSPIFYRKDRLTPVRHGTFWLAPTPGVPGSKGWDAALPRIATWAVFEDRSTGWRFLFMNTHFDHLGTTARTESARLITRRLAELAGALPVILTGDFNFTPEAPGYALLTETLADARIRTETPPHGPEGTFTGFTGEVRPARRIDHVFTGPGLRVLRYGVLAECVDGRFASDHLPVLVILRRPD
ncbi:MAG: endonuclease [Rhodothermaceae bacterium]|nr:MAG: endonuclease [Rhodothermaceae bacterium]